MISLTALQYCLRVGLVSTNLVSKCIFWRELDIPTGFFFSSLKPMQSAELPRYLVPKSLSATHKTYQIQIKLPRRTASLLCVHIGDICTRVKCHVLIGGWLRRMAGNAVNSGNEKREQGAISRQPVPAFRSLDKHSLPFDPTPFKFNTVIACNLPQNIDDQIAVTYLPDLAYNRMFLSLTLTLDF